MLYIILSVIAVIAISVIIYAKYRADLIIKDELILKKHSTPMSKFMMWEGNRIHYTEQGEGETIVMVHGFGGCYFNFNDISQNLSKDFRVISICTPGMGLSEFKGCNPSTDFFNEYKSFFRALFEEIKVDEVYLMGNSLGGLISLEITLDQPERVKGLVLVNSAGYELEKVLANAAGPLRWKWFGNLLSKGMPRIVTDDCLKRAFYDKKKVNPVELQLTYDFLNREGSINTLISLATCGLKPDMERVKNIQTPTLIVWGENDIIIPVKHAHWFKKDIPNSQLKIYDRCGHMAMMEYPNEVAEDFRNFVKTI